MIELGYRDQKILLMAEAQNFKTCSVYTLVKYFFYFAMIRKVVQNEKALVKEEAKG